MVERSHDPEAKTPYDVALDDFFNLLGRKTATEAQIKVAVAGLLEESLLPGPGRQKYIDNWSEDFAYDAEGILEIVGADQDDREEAEGDAPADAATNKLQLVSEATAVLVCNETSRLTEKQKEALMDRTLDLFATEGKLDWIDDFIGPAMAPYIALDAERASMGDDRSGRIARGKFALRLLEDYQAIKPASNRALHSIIKRNK